MANTVSVDHLNSTKRKYKKEKKRLEKNKRIKQKHKFEEEDENNKWIKTFNTIFPKMFTSEVLKNKNALTYQKGTLKILGKEKMTEEYSRINEVLASYPTFSPQNKDHPELNPEKYWRFTMDKPISEIEVVIVGQVPGDPDMSCGLTFSYPHLFNYIHKYAAISWIMEELEDTILGFQKPQTGDLAPWSRRGVLLMNSNLTKTEKLEDPHKFIWHEVTNAITRYIARHSNGVVFMLWGKLASEKRDQILEEAPTSIWVMGEEDWPKLDRESVSKPPHLILECYHPNYDRLCPFQFNGSKHFRIANLYQESIGKVPTEWRLPIMSYLPEDKCIKAMAQEQSQLTNEKLPSSS